MKIFNTKASLNLSINAIVIVVLAMTLLGLGLGFIKSQIGEISGTTTEVQEQVREQITGQLRTSGEKISFPRSITIGRGDRKVLTVGVQNTGSSTVYFGFNLTLDPKNSDHNGSVRDIYDARFTSDPCAFHLGPSEADAYGINIEAPNTAGTDMLKVDVVIGGIGSCGDGEESIGESYASKSTFITVG